MARKRGRLKSAVITPHALDRFIERWRPLDEFDVTPKNPDEWFEKFREVLSGSNRAGQDKVARVLQLINHDEEARFFVNKKYGLKFVIVQSGDSFVIKTVIFKGLEYRPEDIPS